MKLLDALNLSLANLYVAPQDHVLCEYARHLARLIDAAEESGHSRVVSELGGKFLGVTSELGIGRRARHGLKDDAPVEDDPTMQLLKRLQKN